MFSSFSKSWQLVKASGAVLKQDKELMLFPLISSIAAVIVMLSFALPLIGLSSAEAAAENEDAATLLSLGLVFLFYITLYFVIFFFNAALVGAAMIRFEGGDPTVMDGLKIARSKFFSILGYAVIAATVGVILKALQRRAGFVGKIIIGLLGAGWTAATFLVVPVLVTRDVGPFAAVSESAAIFKKTWGENIVGQVGMGAVFSLVYFLLLLGGGILIAVAAASGSGAVTMVVAGLVVVAFVVAALMHATLGGIYSAALYRFATVGSGAGGFEAGALQSAFAQK